MLLLALDTATPAVTVALLAGGEVRARSCVLDARRHAELVTPGIRAVFATAGVRPTALDAVAVGLGPVSYTHLTLPTNREV